MDLLKRIDELEMKINFLIQRQGEQQQQYHRMQEAQQHEFRQIQEAQQYEYRKLQEELFFLKEAYLNQQSTNKQPPLPLQKPVRSTAAVIIYPKNNAASKPEQELRLEKYFGKNIMGIIASLLIFIALISFAILIYDKITDLIKCFAMYLLSIGLGFAGFWFGMKKRNPFSISLLSCGIGGIYISIIATHLVFHYISGIMIYVLLFIWVSGLMLLKEKLQYQKLFRIICQLGVMFSLFLAYADTLSILEYALISLYTFVSFGIIDIKNKEKSAVNLLGKVIMGTSFSTICMINTIVVNNPAWQMKGLVLFDLFIFMIFIVFTVSKFSKETTEYEEVKIIAAAFIGCSFLVGVIIGIAGVFDFNSDRYLVLSIIYLAAILVPGLLSKLRNGMERAIFIPTLIILPILLMSLIQSVSGLNFTGLPLMYIPLLLWGIRQKVVLSTFDLRNYPYIVSILLVFIACICIAAGFKKDFTSFRVYGLVLTIAAVLKLVTYDIMELNSMIRVGAFVVGGLLCFIISRLYNNASKKNERL